MDLSVIIPAYNEANRLPRTLKKITDYFKNRAESFEIIVIDDGSTDQTADTAKTDPVIRVIRHQKNRGKGAAVRTGMLAAQGEWRLLTDADLSTPIEEYERLCADTGQADVIIGSRRVPGAQIIRHQARWKELLGRGGNLLIQLLLVPGVHDTRCGFKLFSADTKKLFTLQRLDRFGYDDEILWLARRYGYRTKEVPVRWINDAQSKVKISDYLKTLSEIARLRLNNWRGRYPKTIE